MILKQIKNLSHKKKEKIRIDLYILFFMYLCLMFWEVFLGPYRSYSGSRRYNLYPFVIRQIILVGFIQNKAN